MLAKCFAVFLLVGVASVFSSDRADAYMKKVLQSYKNFVSDNDMDSVDLDPLNIHFREGVDGVYTQVKIQATGKVTGLSALSISGGCDGPYRDGPIFLYCPLRFYNLEFEYDANITYGNYPEDKVKVTLTSDDVQFRVTIVHYDEYEGETPTVRNNRAVSPGHWSIDLDHDLANEDEVDLAKRIFKNKAASEIVRGEFRDAFAHALESAVEKESLPKPEDE